MSKYFLDCNLELFVRLAYAGLFFHVISSGVCLMGNALFVVVMCISYSFSRRKSVRGMGDLEQACYFSLGKCREPPYLALIYLVSP